MRLVFCYKLRNHTYKETDYDKSLKLKSHLSRHESEKYKYKKIIEPIKLEVCFSKETSY